MLLLPLLILPSTLLLPLGGPRIASCYGLRNGTRFWIVGDITNGDLAEV